MNPGSRDTAGAPLDDAERCERPLTVVEAHDRATAAELEALLGGRGFRVNVEQEGQFAESDIFNLYARRDA